MQKVAARRISSYNYTTMKDFDGVILFIFGTVVALALFFGVVTTVIKSFRPNDEEKNAFHSSQKLSEQKRRMQDINDRQKRLMQDYQQKLRDSRR